MRLVNVVKGRYKDSDKMIPYIIYISSVFLLACRATTFSESDSDNSYSGLSSVLEFPAFVDPFEVRIEEENVLKQYNCKYTGIVYFLHPSGVDGTWIRKYLQTHHTDLNFKHLKLVFPDAPLIRYTPLDAIERHAWIDRQDRTNLGTEDIDTVDNSCRKLREIIDKEVQSGTPLNRIIIGGLQTGGEMALHMAYRCLPDIAGVFALSTYLRKNSLVYEHLARNKTSRRPPLLQAFWVNDQVIPPTYSQETFDKLKALAVQGELYAMQPLEYIMSREEVTHVWRWICKILPNANKNEGFELDFYFNGSQDTDEMTGSD